MLDAGIFHNDEGQPVGEKLGAREKPREKERKDGQKGEARAGSARRRGEMKHF